MRRAAILIGVAALALPACDSDPGPMPRGENPQLPEPRRGLLPEMTIPRPAAWGNDRPAVPPGYRIQAIATDLRIPRQTLILPNGDILVTEGTGGQAAPRLNPKLSLRASSRAGAGPRCRAATG
jgi:glucose/arabinose dehydrogenase